MWNSVATLGGYTAKNSLIVPLKRSIDLPYDSEILLLGNYSREIETYVHTELDMNVCSIIIHGNQIVKSIQTSTKYWLDKDNVVRSCSGMRLSNKKEQCTETTVARTDLRALCHGKEARSMRAQNRQICREGEEINVDLALGMEMRSDYKWS